MQYPSIFALALLVGRSLWASSVDIAEPLQTGSSLPAVASWSDLGRTKALAYSNGEIHVEAFGLWRMTNADAQGDTIHPKGMPIALSLLDGPGGYSFAVATANPSGGEVYVAHSGPSGSLLWNSLTESLPSRDVRGLSFLDGEHLAVVMAGEVFYSQDLFLRTPHWSPVFPSALGKYRPPSSSSVSALDKVGTSYRGSAEDILVGTANGELWRGMAIGGPSPAWIRLNTDQLPGRPVTRVQIDRRDPLNRTFLAVFDQATPSTWMTQDGGDSWTAIGDIATGITQAAYPASVSFSPFYGEAMYAAVPARGKILKAFRSDDGGHSWFSTPRWSGQNVSVEYRRYDRDAHGIHIAPTLRLHNLGSVPVSIKGLQLHYSFSPEGNSPVQWLYDWSPWSQSQVLGTVQKNGLWLTLKSSDILAPGAVSGEIASRLVKGDWTSFDQTNDVSFLQEAFDWTVNNRIMLWSKGTWWSGTVQPR